MGYDISDYNDIHEPYGSLEDCDRLIKEVHARGMKVIFDLVINHTSSEHEWFKESRSSKDSKKRDWYIWRPAKYDAEGKRCRPNNWRSNFSAPAWTWDEGSQEYYLHLYASEQPDLNWENPETRKAIYESAIKFWLDKGIDGFRVDTVNLYSKVPGLPDAPIKYPDQESQPAYQYYANGPRMHEFLHEINDVAAAYDTMTVGELPYTPNQADVLAYIKPDPVSQPSKIRQEKALLDMVFNFDTVDLGQTPGNRFDLRPFGVADFKKQLLKWHLASQSNQATAAGAWNTVFLENHDQARSVSRFASDLPQFRELASKMFALILSTLSGTLFIYQGQEIGMINAPATWPRENYKCIKSRNHLADVEKRTHNDPAAMKEALAALHRMARDHGRVPMQWTPEGRNGGFTNEDVTPWMEVLESHKEINVENQLNRKDSPLTFWTKALEMRKNLKELFVYGAIDAAPQGVEQQAEQILVFEKIAENGMKSLTVANISKEKINWALPASIKTKKLAGNYEDGSDEEASLRPFEARVYIIDEGLKN